MKLKNEFFILFALLLIASVFSPAQELWAHLYQEFQFEDPLPDHFRNTISPFSAGGYLGAFQSRGCYCIYFFRIDIHGNVIWARKFDNIDEGEVFDIGEGKIGLIGSHIFGLPSIGTWLMTFDENGNIISQEFNDSIIFSTARKVLGDNYYVLSGRSSVAFARLNPETGVFTHSKNYFFSDSGDYFVSDGNLFLNDDGVLIGGVGIGMPANITLTVIKVDYEGNLIWAKSYEAADGSIMSPSSDGGFFLFTWANSLFSDSTLWKIDAKGEILWQEKLRFPDFPEISGVYINGIRELTDGTILIDGFIGIDYSDYSGDDMSGQKFIAALDSAGQPLWCRVYKEFASYFPSHQSRETLLETEDSIILISIAPMVFYEDKSFSPEIISLDKSGYSHEQCPQAISIQMEAVPTYFGVCDELVAAYDVEIFPMKPMSADIGNVELRDSVICGEQWPCIISVQKKTNPFRLKLTGWNFEKGSKVYINGVKAGKVVFKGTDDLNRTKLVVNGSGLKSKLPKGQSVCITVKNPDGRESDCFYFTR